VRFDQSDFYEEGRTGLHAISYVTNQGTRVLHEPFDGRSGESFSDVRGSESDENFGTNIGGYIFVIQRE